MKLFTVHMRILTRVSQHMKNFLRLAVGRFKRGYGCDRPLESLLRGLYVAERNASDEYEIQTIGGWRTIYASFEERRDLSCRQLWLFLMRHDDAVLEDQIAYVAHRLGFYSDTIAKRAAEYASADHYQAVEPEYSPWAAPSEVPVDERLGQKGDRWLRRCKTAKQYLYFDVAETTGTEAANGHQDPRGFTYLTELASVYRAFFADPLLPHPHAQLPTADCGSSTGSLESVHTISELSSPMRLPSDGRSNQTDANEWTENGEP
ncbi:hypothetical protein, partial [Streptomyces sp. NPDC021139]|uniref:hypothetical protein n=1 Tax=Streptomyces sp. NPDC021139 TaxID=3154899 RepID=UPI0033F9AC78